jgi:dTDP-4-amino-4,6-dideoxygalactose transaminase
MVFPVRERMSSPIRIPLSDFRIEQDDLDAVERTLRGGWITAGPQTEQLEQEYASLLGVRHAVAMSSCTAALQLAWESVGVGPGDEVIVPSITFVATAGTIHQCGATPIAADLVSAKRPSIDVADVARRITPRTKAVCAMHYAGYPADTEGLHQLCRDNGLVLIEDAAHHPKLRPIGAATCLSFFTNKVLACGEGGLMATNDDAIARFARTQRVHGVDVDTWTRHHAASLGYDVPRFGHNFRFDDIRASLLRSRLQRVDAEIEARRMLVRRYRSLLSHVEQLEVPYHDADVASSACYIMPVVLGASLDRAAIRNHMRTKSAIQTSVLYPALHELSAWPESGRGARPVAELFARRQLTLPLFAHMAPSAVDEVVDALVRAIAHVGEE